MFGWEKACKESPGERKACVYPLSRWSTDQIRAHFSLQCQPNRAAAVACSDRLARTEAQQLPLLQDQALGGVSSQSPVIYRIKSLLSLFFLIRFLKLGIGQYTEGR